MNPMLQMLRPQGNLAQIKQMAQMMKTAQNPQAMLNSLMAQNPQMRQVMDFVRQNGNNPREAFYSLAKQKGVNPDDILNMLK